MTPLNCLEEDLARAAVVVTTAGGSVLGSEAEALEHPVEVSAAHRRDPKATAQATLSASENLHASSGCHCRRVAVVLINFPVLPWPNLEKSRPKIDQDMKGGRD